MQKNEICLLPLAVALASGQASAQTDDKKTEVGIHFSLLQQSGRELRLTSSLQVPGVSLFGGTAATADSTNSGFGGRLGYNLSSHFTVEGEVDFLPTQKIGAGGRKVAGLFGVKTGTEVDKFGIFAKARPGFIFFSRSESACSQTSTLVTSAPCTAGSETKFAIDLGGVIEYYPTPRSIIRVDLGDTMIHFGEQSVSFTFPATPGIPVPAPRGAKLGPSTSHNFQVGIGLAIRF